MTDKNRTIDELLNILEVKITDFQRKLDDEISIAFLKRAKKAGLIETFVGDPENKDASEI